MCIYICVYVCYIIYICFTYIYIHMYERICVYIYIFISKFKWLKWLFQHQHQPFSDKEMLLRDSFKALMTACLCSHCSLCSRRLRELPRLQQLPEMGVLAIAPILWGILRHMARTAVASSTHRMADRMAESFPIIVGTVTWNTPNKKVGHCECAIFDVYSPRKRSLQSRSRLRVSPFSK